MKVLPQMLCRCDAYDHVLNRGVNLANDACRRWVARCRGGGQAARIVVVGGGINGLASALALRQTGFTDVTLIAEHFSPGITSDIAGTLD